MNIRIVLLTLSITALAAAPAQADHSKRVYMITAGSLLVNVQQLRINNPVDPTDDTIVNTAVIDQRAWGTLGSATIKLIATSRNEPPDPAGCPDDFPVKIVRTDDSIVLTFRDLSQLFGVSTAEVCVDPLTGEQFVVSVGEWTGGTGRFHNVTGGRLKIITERAVPVSLDGQFLTAAGRIVGRLKRD